MHRIGAVTLNYKTPDDTAETVRSLLGCKGVDLFVVLIENGSGGDSWEKLQAAFGGEPRVRLVRSEVNTGFAGGNNLGIKRVMEEGATDVFLVSSDVIVEPDCPAKVCDAMDRWGAWAAQPMMISRKTGKVDTLGHMVARESRGVTEVGHGADVPALGGTPAFEVFGVCAGAAMYRREAFEKVGLLPEDFFIYFEDVDMSFRIKHAGGKTLLVPSARAYHTRFGSAGGWALKHYYEERNALAIKLHHYTARDLMSITMVGHLRRAAFEAVKGRRVREFARVLVRWLLKEHAAPSPARRALLDAWQGVERRPVESAGDLAKNPG